MAGGLVIALPLYVWRLHDTEVTEEDLTESKILEGKIDTVEAPREMKEESTTVISEKRSL